MLIIARLDKNTENGLLAYVENSIKVWIDDMAHSNLSRAVPSGISPDSTKNLMIALVENSTGVENKVRLPKPFDTLFSDS